VAKCKWNELNGFAAHEFLISVGPPRWLMTNRKGILLDLLTVDSWVPSTFFMQRLMLA